jgi:hypothetical protein
MAAVNAGHMTKLEAVNDMLWSIGESPVLSLASGLGDASQAEAVLDRVSRTVQLVGWHVNTQRAKVLTLNASDQFALGVNVLKIDTVNRSSHRKTSAPTPSKWVNAVMRRSADDTKWLMYDMDNLTELWTNSGLTTLTVDEVQFLDFANLTPALQHYVWTMAARRFQQGAMGSQVLDAVSTRDVNEALIQAVQEDSENEDLNIIRDNAHVRAIVWRNNPNAGT